MSGLNLGYELVREPRGTLTAFAGGRMAYVKSEIDINGTVKMQMRPLHQLGIRKRSHFRPGEEPRHKV